MIYKLTILFHMDCIILLLFAKPYQADVQFMEDESDRVLRPLDKEARTLSHSPLDI